MAFRRMLLQVTCTVVVMLSEIAAVAVAGQLAKPNCEHWCGDVEIPYPFGTTDDCYLNKQYFIDCSDLSGRSQPLSENTIVTSISIDGEIEILMFIARQCFNSTGVLGFKNKPWTNYPYFTISNTKNKFVNVGCDSVSYLSAFQNNGRLMIGCFSACESPRNVANGSCSGIGCCEVDIPRGLKNFTLDASSINNHTTVSDFNPCSFAFVAKQDEFHFSSKYLRSLEESETYPMVLDWAIGNEKCETARNKPDYVCGGNSECYNPPEGVDGYRCKCNKGYEGNPYLHDGCQDINECQVQKPACKATATCTNIEGSFTCTCPDGYKGDGNINGTGCNPKASGIHAKIIIIALIVFNAEEV